MWVSGETGLMGLAIDPGFAENRRIYTCQGWKLPGGKQDIRVIAWKLNAGLTAVGRPDVLLKGLPTVSGRHGGCRLLIAKNGALLVGTGDAAVTKNPQSLRSFGGKTLRLNPATGRPWPTNPWADQDGRKRFIYTYGHRNVQGLAQRARRHALVGRARHLPRRRDQQARRRPQLRLAARPRLQRVPADDELLAAGPPVGGHGGAPATRRSPRPAPPSSAGRGWGSSAGTLAVGCLAGERLMFVKFDADGDLRWTRAPERLRDFGRLRGVTAYRGSLLVTTSNGGGNDKILRVGRRADHSRQRAGRDELAPGVHAELPQPGARGDSVPCHSR